MKKLSFFLIASSISLCSFSQVIVNLTSVPCNTGLEGWYPFEYAGESGGYTDWSCPNMLIPSNAVAGPLEFINDSTPGIVGNGITPHGSPIGVPPIQNVLKGYLGCDTLGNPTQDLAGKIAVIYRGTCEFGYKALNAQQRGAIGVIIINHTGDPITMAGGTYGTRVTIPVVMISRSVGDELRIAIESCPPDSVTGFIGTKVGVFSNDIATGKGDFLMPQELAIPYSMVYNVTPNYNIDLGLWSYNIGNNAQIDVTTTVNVYYNNFNLVYSQTSTPIYFAAPDFSDSLNPVVDTQYISLGTYAPSNWNNGEYLVEYIINNAGDEDLSDNSFSYNFRITYNTYAKSRTDNGWWNPPVHNTAYVMDETSIYYDDWEACIVLNKKYYSWNNPYVTGMTFSASPTSGVGVGIMTDEILEIKAYQWNDSFIDITDTVTFDALTLVTYGLYFFPGTPDSLDNIFVPFDFPIILNNNQRYLFCVYNSSDLLRINYDKEPNYKATINHYQQPIAPLKMKPNNNPAIWDWKGFGFDKIPAISVNFDGYLGVDGNFNQVNIIPYPNPTTNLLTVPIRQGVSGNVKVEVFDLTGKLVLSENKIIGNEPLKVNVASIKNGAYLFQLTFVDGTTDVFKISVNR